MLLFCISFSSACIVHGISYMFIRWSLWMMTICHPCMEPLSAENLVNWRLVWSIWCSIWIQFIANFIISINRMWSASQLWHLSLSLFVPMGVPCQWQIYCFNCQWNVPTILQSLGCIAQCSVSDLGSQIEEITSYICQKIIQVLEFNHE